MVDPGASISSGIYYIGNGKTGMCLRPATTAQTKAGGPTTPPQKLEVAMSYTNAEWQVIYMGNGLYEILHQTNPNNYYISFGDNNYIMGRMDGVLPFTRELFMIIPDGVNAYGKTTYRVVSASSGRAGFMATPRNHVSQSIWPVIYETDYTADLEQKWTFEAANV